LIEKLGLLPALIKRELLLAGSRHFLRNQLREFRWVECPQILLITLNFGN
jgi:hypothetical protein